MPSLARRPCALLALPVLVATACGAPGGEADRYLAFQRQEGGWVVAPRDRGTLDDLATLAGSLGEVRTGGIILYEDDGSMTSRGGRALDVGYDVQDGVAVPFDEDGLILWSFYGHLEDLEAELAELGLDGDAGRVGRVGHLLR